MAEAEKYREPIEFIRAALISANEAILCIRADGQIEFSSIGFENRFSVSNEATRGQDIATLLPDFQPLQSLSHDHSDDEYIHDSSRTILTTGGNESVPVSVSINPIEIDEARFFTLFLHDLRDQVKREQALEHQSLHDRLTNLPNRKYLHKTIGKQLSNDDSLTVCLLSLNYFKEINDLYGHECGDKVLIAFSERLKKYNRDGACSFRLDGAEFAMTFRQRLSKQEINAHVKALSYMCQSPFVIDDYTIELGVSIGIAISTTHSITETEEILHQADIALQNCRETQVKYVVFDAQLENQQVAYVEIIPMLRRAIESDQLQVHFQPKVCLRTGDVIGCEMLTRWITEEGDRIPPDLFIKIAENAQLMENLIFSCLFKLADLEEQWTIWSLPRKVAINLSAKLLSNKRFIGELISCVDTLLGHLDIEFEITETALMANPAVALKSISELKQSGYTIAIDDFGTGYSSLAYIRDLGADVLKIDKSFIDDIADNEDSQIIVKSTIGMAHDLGLTVVAEGIENASQQDYLKRINCDVGQGYLYAKAMDFRGYGKWFKTYQTIVDDGNVRLISG